MGRVIQTKCIPSYIEVRLDNGKHFDQLDRHIRTIMKPHLFNYLNSGEGTPQFD